MEMSWQQVVDVAVFFYADAYDSGGAVVRAADSRFGPWWKNVFGLPSKVVPAQNIYTKLERHSHSQSDLGVVWKG